VEIAVAAADAEIATSFSQIVAFSVNGDHSVDLGHSGFSITARENRSPRRRNAIADL